MKKHAVFLFVAMFLVLSGVTASYGQEEIKVGVMHSLTGSIAPAGALSGQKGSLVAIDMINARGGVAGKYKIKAVEADAQSNPDVAIREAERLISVEKVPVIVGVFSSAIAVPLAPICDKNKTIFWITIAISDKVLEDRKLKYVFRMQPMGSQWGNSSVDMLSEIYGNFGYKNANQLKLAVASEDGPYGSIVSQANLDRAKKYGMPVGLTEAYTHTTKDLSSLILKIKGAKPDVVLHTGYFPDVVLLMRQSRELGLKWKGLIGHGAGYANFRELEKSLGRGLVNYACNVDPAPAQLLDPKKLKPGIGDLIQEFLKRYKERYKESDPETHATQGFSHTWVLLNDVMPLALKKYGKITPDTIRQAALEIDLPEGGTPSGYGVKFAGPDHKFSGQNLRSYPVVSQWLNGKVEIVWPKGLRTTEPKLPVGADSPFAAK
jgi:branched-chain amino acid transport system substrate-binding protein